MEPVKRQLTSSYQDFLIDRLQDDNHAAGYLTAILEEKDPEPQLFLSALEDVIAAKVKAGTLSETHYQQVETLCARLGELGESQVYALVDLLNALGLQLSVTLQTEP